MNQGNQGVKIVFGIVIFLFSTTLAYFAANYLNGVIVHGPGDALYWLIIAAFAAVYTTIGILVSSIFTVALGFIFAADVIVVHILFRNFGEYDSILKLIVIGIILGVLYFVAFKKLTDKDEQIAPVSGNSDPGVPGGTAIVA